MSCLSTLPAPPRRGRAPRQRAGAHYFTDREREILGLLADGCSISGIAATLGVARSTVTSFRATLRDKLGCADLAAVAAWARQARGKAASTAATPGSVAPQS